MKLPSRSLSYANRPAPLLPIQYYIYTRARGTSNKPYLCLASPWHKRARFGEAEQKSYLCISRKRKSAGFSSFRVLRGQLSYMSGKIVLYDRKNYKQARKNLLGDNFYEVLYREKFHDFRRNYQGANFRYLNYPYIFAPHRLNDCKRVAHALRRQQSSVNRFLLSSCAMKAGGA